MKFNIFMSMLLIVCSAEVNFIPLEQFFPFGTAAGDEILNLGDDDSSDLVSLSPPLTILGRQRTSLRV